MTSSATESARRVTIVAFVLLVAVLFDRAAAEAAIRGGSLSIFSAAAVSRGAVLPQ